MDTNTIDSQLTYLEETKSLLKEAIVNKGQTIQEMDTFRSYVDKIDQISTLAEETADANATGNDIVKGKIAYANGEKIIGTLSTQKSIQNAWNKDDPYGDGNIYISTKNNIPMLNIANHFKLSDANMKVLIEAKADGTGTMITTYAPSSEVAAAIGLTADKIIEGNTILGVVGTGKTSEDLQAQLDAQDELITSQQAQIEELKSLLADKASNITNESIETVNNVLGNEEV